MHLSVKINSFMHTKENSFSILKVELLLFDLLPLSQRRPCCCRVYDLSQCLLDGVFDSRQGLLNSAGRSRWLIGYLTCCFVRFMCLFTGGFYFDFSRDVPQGIASGAIQIPNFEEKVTHSYTHRLDFGPNFDQNYPILFSNFLLNFLPSLAQIGKILKQVWLKLGNF